MPRGITEWKAGSETAKRKKKEKKMMMMIIVNQDIKKKRGIEKEYTYIHIYICIRV